MNFVRDSRGEPIEIGDEVVEKSLFSSRLPRHGLVIDVYPAAMSHRGQIRVELSDEGYPEIVAPASMWRKLTHDS